VIWAVQDRAMFDNVTSVTGYGHYTERWVRQGDMWKLASLRLSSYRRWRGDMPDIADQR
jgi:hypothetical protein